MITKIINWIREWVARMIGQTSIEQAIGVQIAISDPMLRALEQWDLMYRNEAEWLNEKVRSLNLPVAIASEISRVATLELEVAVEGSLRADYLNAQFEKVVDRMRDVIEFGAAKGGLIFKPYIDGANIAVDYIQADQFYPVRFDATGAMTAAVFIDQRQIGSYYYTRLESHEMGADGYLVRNTVYRASDASTLGNQVGLGVVEEWANLAPEALITGIDRPLFAYFRYPLANSIDPASPLGVSCYSRAVDLIRQADIQWSNLLWEFESGQRALYLDVLAFGKDANGKPVLPDKRLYRMIETGSMEGDLFHDWTPTLREQNIINGMDAILKRIEFTCGLAYGTLSDPQTVDRTATEIKISKQRSYATVVDTQKAIRNALDGLLYAMDAWATIGQLAPRGEYRASYYFDDSVTVDADQQFQKDLQLVQQAILSPVEFRMRNFREDEETARAKIAEIKAGMGGLFDGQV